MCERYPEGAAAPPLPPPPFDISSGPKQLFVIFSYPLTPRSDDLNADAYRQILANKQTNKQFSFKFDLGATLDFHVDPPGPLASGGEIEQSILPIPIPGKGLTPSLLFDRLQGRGAGGGSI